MQLADGGLRLVVPVVCEFEPVHDHERQHGTHHGVRVRLESDGTLERFLHLAAAGRHSLASCAAHPMTNASATSESLRVDRVSNAEHVREKSYQDVDNVGCASRLSLARAGPRGTIGDDRFSWCNSTTGDPMAP